MDRTLKPSKLGKQASKRHKIRNQNTWQSFAPNGKFCRFCPHDNLTHTTSSGPPHFYRPAMPEERQYPSRKLYLYGLPKGRSTLVKRITVAKYAELISAFCTDCAKEKDTKQVLCYQRTLAKGEVIRVETNGAGGTI